MCNKTEHKLKTQKQNKMHIMTEYCFASLYMGVAYCTNTSVPVPLINFGFVFVLFFQKYEQQILAFKR